MDIVLGYFMFASMMGAVGAMVPSFREAGQFTFFIIFPLLVRLLFNNVFSKTPNHSLAVALSLFPLTAPTAMMSRLAGTFVPFWQLAASAGLLAATTAMVVQVSARAFRADMLLSSSVLKWDRFLRLLLIWK